MVAVPLLLVCQSLCASYAQYCKALEQAQRRDTCHSTQPKTQTWESGENKPVSESVMSLHLPSVLIWHTLTYHPCVVHFYLTLYLTRTMINMEYNRQNKTPGGFRKDFERIFGRVQRKWKRHHSINENCTVWCLPWNRQRFIIIYRTNLTSLIQIMSHSK